jgi:hypothetical protein
MKHHRVKFQWLDHDAFRGVRTGVSLHGHTLHSKECLSSIPHYVRRLPAGRSLLRARAREADFARAYWTPPLTPASALQLEREQIARLGLAPMVSLTDHDDIDAGLSLQVTHPPSEVPVSVEWTVPFAGSILHLGIHNLPRQFAPDWMAEMADYTAGPCTSLLSPLLSGLARSPGVLVVLNHPFWREAGVDEPAHKAALASFLPEYGRFLHAFELNATRSWNENLATIALAGEFAAPVVSGGDRHGCEPSACVNLTGARTFAEFAAEVRDGHSTVLFLCRYREPMVSRILQTTWEILKPYPEYPGRERWTDRVFYRCDDGQVRSLSQVWGGRTPWPARCGAAFVEFVAKEGLRSALRFVLPNRAEIAL